MCGKSKTCAGKVKVELKKVQMGLNWRKKGETWAELRESRLSCRWEGTFHYSPLSSGHFYKIPHSQFFFNISRQVLQREGWRYQIEWIFRKNPNEVWLPPPLIFGKLYCKFFIMDMVAFMQGRIGQIVSGNTSKYQFISVNIN